MTDDPRGDAVARQYGRWRYPFPIEDLPGWLEGNWEWFDPSHAQRVLWPDREYRRDLDILIAGCGTNQAAVFAFTNPSARVVAIDVSQPSLDHEEHLREKYGLSNLTLRRLPIEEAPTMGLDFDLVVSTGVLHHLADPPAGLRALGACARPDAAIGLMLYARYGRLGVEMLAGVFEEMGLRQDEASVAMVREALALVPPTHPVRTYLTIARDLQADAALVDTFLHARERSYRVPDCLELVAAAGLEFQTWFLNAPYYLHDLSFSQRGIGAAIRALPDATHWSVMERLYPANACHFFVVCRPERSKATYAIDFSSSSFLDYVPELRKGCGLEGPVLFRPDWRTQLDAQQLPFVRRVDGRRSIGEIAMAVARDAGGTRAQLEDAEDLSRELFGALWRLDFLAFGLPPGERR